MGKKETLDMELIFNMDQALAEVKIMTGKLAKMGVQLKELSYTKGISEVTNEFKLLSNQVGLLFKEFGKGIPESQVEGVLATVGKLSKKVDEFTKYEKQNVKENSNVEASVYALTKAYLTQVNTYDKVGRASKKLKGIMTEGAFNIPQKSMTTLKTYYNKLHSIQEQISTLKDTPITSVGDIEKAKNVLVLLEREFANTSSEADKLVHSFDKIKNVDSTIDKAAIAYANANTALIKYKDNEEKLQKIINQKSKFASKDAIASAEKYYKVLQDGIHTEKEHVQGSKDAIAEVKRLQQAQLAARDALIKANSRANKSTTTVNTKKKALEKTTKELTAALRKQADASLKANREVQKHTTALSKQSGLKWAANIAKRAAAYYSLYQAMQLVITAAKESVKYTLEQDKAARTLAAVTDGHKDRNAALRTGIALEKEVIKLTHTYGGTLEEVNKVAIELARAGVGTDDLIKSTEVVAKLAKLTGDTIEKSASVMVTYLHVFGQGADATNSFALSVEELGGKLAYMANASKLSTEDIGTFSNYALASAKAAGATIDVINGMGAALTNAGNTASTAGTSVRKFFLSLRSDASNVQKFFKAVGISQVQLTADIAKGGETSNNAIFKMLKTFKSFNIEEFAKATAGLPVRLQAALNQFYQTGDAVVTHAKNSINSGVKELNKADLIIDSMGTTWERLGQITNSVGSDIVSKALVPLSEMLGDVLDSSDGATENIRTFFDVIVGGATAAGIAVASVGGIMAIASSPAVLSFLAMATPIAAAIGVVGAGAVAIYNQHKDRAAADVNLKRISQLRTAVENINKSYATYKSSLKGVEGDTKQQAIIQNIYTATLNRQVKAYADLQHISIEVAKKDLLSDKVFKSLPRNAKYVKTYSSAITELNKVEAASSNSGKKVNLGIMEDATYSKEIKKLNYIKTFLANTKATELGDYSTVINNIVEETKNAARAQKAFFVENKAGYNPKVYKEVINLMDKVANATSSKELVKVQTDLIGFNQQLKKDKVDLNEQDKEALATANKSLERAGKRLAVEESIKKVINTTNQKANIAEQKEKAKIEAKVLKLAKAYIVEQNKEAGNRLKATKNLIKQYDIKEANLVAETKYNEQIKDIDTQRARIGEKISDVQKSYLDSVEKVKKAKTTQLLDEKKLEILGNKYNKLVLQKVKLQEKSTDSENDLKAIQLAENEIAKTGTEITNVNLSYLEDQLKVEQLIEAQRLANLRLNGSISDGMKETIDNYKRNLPKAFEIGTSLMETSLQSMERGFTDFFDNQSANFMYFGKLGKSILNDIANQMLKMSVVKPLAAAGSSLLSSIGGSVVDSLFGSTPLFENGGRTGKAASDKQVAGVVHANEYVIPANMVRKHPALVQGLEAERKGLRGFYLGGGVNGTGGRDLGGTSGAEANTNSSGYDAEGHDKGYSTYGGVLQEAAKTTTKNVGLIDSLLKGVKTLFTDPAKAVKDILSGLKKGLNNLPGVIAKAGTTVLGAILGAPMGTLGSAVLGAFGGKLADKKGWSDLTFSGIFGTNTKNSPIENTVKAAKEVKQGLKDYADALQGGSEDVITTVNGLVIDTNTTVQDIVDFVEQTGTKLDVIKSASDLYKTIFDKAPTVIADANLDWNALSDSFVQNGNDALLKTVLDGSLFDTPDFYSVWEEYAKSINGEVTAVIKESLATIVDKRNTFQEFLLRNDSVGLAEYKAQTLKDQTATIAEGLGVDFATLTSENFLDKYNEAIQNSFTPETITSWNGLADAFISATTAQEDYKKALLETQQAQYQTTLDSFTSLADIDSQIADVTLKMKEDRANVAAANEQKIADELLASRKEALNAEIDANTLILENLNLQKPALLAQQKSISSIKSTADSIRIGSTSPTNIASNFSNTLKQAKIDFGNKNYESESLSSLSDVAKLQAENIKNTAENYASYIFATNLLADKVDSVYSGTSLETVDSSLSSIEDAINTSTDTINNLKTKLTDITNAVNNSNSDANSYYVSNALDLKNQYDELLTQRDTIVEQTTREIDTLSTYLGESSLIISVLNAILSSSGIGSNTISNALSGTNGNLNIPDVNGNVTTSTTDNGANITNVTDTIVNSYYESILGRSAEQGGLDYWTNAIDSGSLTIAQVASSISKSKEAKLKGVTPFASGGIVTKPTMSLIGEAGYNEAVIPLKDSNDPLQMKAVVQELHAVKAELVELKKLQIKQTANSGRQLSTQRALLSEQIGA